CGRLRTRGGGLRMTEPRAEPPKGGRAGPPARVGTHLLAGVGRTPGRTRNFRARYESYDLHTGPARHEPGHRSRSPGEDEMRPARIELATSASAGQRSIP